jgi:hypothetical protein
MSTPLSVRARLNSLNSQATRPKKATSSSTITLRGQIPRKANTSLHPPSPSNSGSGSSDESEAEALKAEEAEKAAEEDSALERRIKDLERMVTNENLGLVQSVQYKSKGKHIDRGRASLSASKKLPLPDGLRIDPNLVHEPMRSHSVSSADSPQGSVPSIPSPPPESQRSSPISIQHRLSPGKSSSPPAVSPRSVRGMHYQALVRANTAEHGSAHGSSASSFSDLSGESLQRLLIACSRLSRCISLVKCVGERSIVQHAWWFTIVSLLSFSGCTNNVTVL